MIKVVLFVPVILALFSTLMAKHVQVSSSIYNRKTFLLTWNFFSADINECDSGSECDDRAICSNTNGSFDCTCRAGYTGSGLPGECTGIRIIPLHVLLSS